LIEPACVTIVDPDAVDTQQRVDGVVTPGPYARVFSFDGVFDPWGANNADVYRAAVRPLVATVLQGTNAAVLAYGITGSGKTRTMFGTRYADAHFASRREDLPDADGVSTLAVTDLFDVLRQGQPAAAGSFLPNRASGATAAAVVQVTFVEVYNERVFDLLRLDDDQQRAAASNVRTSVRRSSSQVAAGTVHLEVVDHATHGTIASGAQEVFVQSEEELHTLIACGLARRTTAPTMMNAKSSRSHALLTLTVRQRRKPTRDENHAGPNAGVVASRLTLVDLAGSERADAASYLFPATPSGITTGTSASRAATAAQARHEGSTINRSLLTLGACIAALASAPAASSAAPRVAVPYRESKLTRLLRDCLGGNTRTAILAVCTPTVAAYHETLAALRFVENARRVVRAAPLRQGRVTADVAEMRAVYAPALRAATAEVERLRELVAQARTALEAAQRRQAPFSRSAANAATSAPSPEFMRQLDFADSSDDELTSCGMAPESDRPHGTGGPQPSFTPLSPGSSDGASSNGNHDCEVHKLPCTRPPSPDAVPPPPSRGGAGGQFAAPLATYMAARMNPDVLARASFVPRRPAAQEVGVLGPDSYAPGHRDSCTPSSEIPIKRGVSSGCWSRGSCIASSVSHDGDRRAPSKRLSQSSAAPSAWTDDLSPSPTVVHVRAASVFPSPSLRGASLDLHEPSPSPRGVHADPCDASFVLPPAGPRASSPSATRMRLPVWFAPPPMAPNGAVLAVHSAKPPRENHVAAALSRFVPVLNAARSPVLSV
jgi:hypothetical protein